jgi:hypothetical protein
MLMWFKPPFVDVGLRGTVVDITKRLDLPQLHRCALTLSAGQWHPGLKRFRADMDGLVDALAQEGQALPGVLSLSLSLSLFPPPSSPLFCLLQAAFHG